MSKSLELLANIDKKYNNALQTIEAQLAIGIEQTSQTIKESLSTRASTTASAIQQSDEKVAQSLRSSAQTVEKQLHQYQALLESKLSHLTQLNEQLQTQAQEAQNQKIERKLTTLIIAMISLAAILLIVITSLGYVSKNKYNEIKSVNMTINEKQLKIDHLNQSGGNLTISNCKPLNSKTHHLCIQINKNAGEWQNGYMIPMGY